MKRILAISLLWAALVVPGLFARGYWNPDEPRNGAVAREVWRGDGSVVPHLNGEIYREKPPLYFWLVAACQAASGSLSAAASRVPSALSSLFTALLLMGLVRRTHGEREAGWAAGIFLTSALVIQMSGWLGIDMFVTFLVTACLYLQERAAAASRRFLFVAGIYTLLAALILAKGAPVFIALIAMGGAAWLRSGPRALLGRHMIWGVPLLLGLLAAWAVPAAREAGWDYIRGLTLGQAGRRLVDSDSHQQPVWYYVLRFPPLFLPWALLIPAAVVQLRRDWRGGGRDRTATGRYLLWFVVPFVVFSLISGKRERYILPLFPAAAALVAVAMVRLEGDRRFRRLVRGPILGMAVVLGVAGIATAAGPFLLDRYASPELLRLGEEQFVEVMNRLRGGFHVLLFAGIGAALVALEGILRRRRNGPGTAVLASAAFLMFGLSGGAVPALDRAKSCDSFVESCSRVDTGDGAPVLIDLRPGAFCLAFDRHDFTVLRGLDAGERARRMVLGGGPRIYFTQAKYFRRLQGQMLSRDPGLHLIRLSERRAGGRSLIAFTSRFDRRPTRSGTLPE